MPTLKQTLSQLLLAKKGGRNRIQIIEALAERPYNTNQLAESLGLNYRTVKHHLSILMKHGLILPSSEGTYGETYFLSPKMTDGMYIFNEVIKKLDDMTASPKFFHRMMEQTDIAVIIIDTEGGVFFWNKSAERLYGYKGSEILGKRVPIFENQSLLENMMSLLAEKPIWIVETTGLRKEGGAFDIRATMEAIKNEEGDIVCFSIITVDITEQKRDRAELAKSEERYHLLFDNAPMGIVIADLDGHLVDLNDTVLEITGLKKRDLVGKRFTELKFLRKKDLNRLGEILLRGIAGEKVEGIELIVNVQGEKRCVEFSSAPLWKGDDIYAFQVLARDVTDEKRAQRDIKEAKELYESLVTASPEAITATDLEGKVTYVSRRTIELHGYDRGDELLGKSALEFIHPRDHKRAIKNLEKTLSEGTVRNIKYELVRKDGDTFTGELNAALIRDSRGKPKGFIATTRDVETRAPAKGKRKRK